MIRHVQYDVLDIDAKGFDNDFYDFRSKTKELERRLSSVVSQAFDDSKSIMDSLKLLDSFDDLLERYKTFFMFAQPLRGHLCERCIRC
jgi:dynein heavy chain